MRLYDHLMREPVYPFAGANPAPISAIREAIETANRFVVDNVADYFYNQRDIEDWDLFKDFPNITPVFEKFWVEYRVPDCFRSRVFGREVIKKDGGGFTFVGAHMHGVEVRKDSQLQGFHMLATVYVGSSYGNSGPVISWRFVLDISGNPVPGECVTIIPESSELVTDRGMRLALARIFFPILLALSFLHCKNIRVQTVGPDRPLTHREIRQKQRPLVTYRVLDIVPMRQVLDREGHAQETGLKKALHICRGHFADYTEGHGLFGKHHGRFWVPSHVRGSADVGVALKDYRVRAPASTEG